MQIYYNLTGAKRKELVSAISQVLNVPANYLEMPTAVYKVGGYIIDKNQFVAALLEMAKNHNRVTT